MRPRWLDVIAIVLLAGAALEIRYLSSQINRLRREKSEIELLVPPEAIRGVKLLPLSARQLSGVPSVIDAGQVSTIFFLSPGCGACAQVLPSWKATTRKLGFEHTLVLAPELSPSTARELSDYVRLNGLRSETAMVIPYPETKRLRLYGVPRILLVGKSGTVVAAWRGPVDSDELFDRWMIEARKGEEN